jgi:hypothetical protein
MNQFWSLLVNLVGINQIAGIAVSLQEWFNEQT